ncbi:MAG: hypothetical protein H0X25_16580 [Acidobacteriales bacterium]|nr:hypothetical protein [Terriglobales bacterium]
MAVANRDTKSVSILLGNGDGTFQAHVDYSAAAGPASIVAKDLNHDGLPDLLVAAQDANVVSVLLNNGDGTFAPHIDFAVVYSVTALGHDGRLYGTTYQGGIVSGTVWAFSKGGNLGVLHDFSSYPGDGEHPSAGVVQDASGNLYGAATYGGFGYGVVYKLSRNGTEKVYMFHSPPDGEYPYGGVLLGKSGSIYGTAQIGGAFGAGTVFKVSMSGQETTLHSFDKLDGDFPTGNLAGDEEGNLYGTTNLGGLHSSGVIFKIGPGGVFTVLYNFGEYIGDASVPFAGVVRDAEGNLYGTTSSGGQFGDGTVYKLDATTGNLTILHSFAGGSDGSYAISGVTLDPAGSLYGTTVYGGTNNFGVVYKITP